MLTYTLDPALQRYIDASANFSPVNDSLEARRDAFARACRYFTPDKPSGLRIEDQWVDGLRTRLYVPESPAPADGWPTLLYVHGGGWNMGDHRTHDWFAFALAKRLPVAIVALDYRLAPEHPFPAPLDDVLRVWGALRSGQWNGLSRERLAVAGDSAGGTIAAGLCMALRALGQPQPLLQLLAYPVLSARDHFASMHEHADAPMLTTKGLKSSLAGYVPDEARKSDPLALPLEAESFDRLAPAFVAAAQFDPLSDHARAYVQALIEADVPAQLHIGSGLVHASLRSAGVCEVERMYDAMADALHKHLFDAIYLA